MKMIRRQDYPHELLKSSRTGEEFSHSAVLSSVLNSEDFFIRHEILSPGKRASSPHYHEQTEEFVFVIKGTIVVTEGNETSEMTVGDAALFTANAKLGHCIENTATVPAEFLVFSKRLQIPDVTYL